MITISDIAKKNLINLINKKGVAALLYLKGGGCNGFSYKFKILKDESKVNRLDELYKLDDKNLYLCNKSLMYIIGTKIDYKDDIMGSRFDFKNDNMKNKCGCGTSFNFK
jgi:iron-sulfur cluster assembly accessory protein